MEDGAKSGWRGVEGHPTEGGRATWALGVELQGKRVLGAWQRSLGERGSRGRAGMGGIRPFQQPGSSRGRGPPEWCVGGEPAGRSGGRFIFTRWHLQNVQLMAVGRQEVLLSVLSLFPQQPAQPGAGGPRGTGPGRGGGDPWVARYGAGRTGAAGWRRVPAELLGRTSVCPSPALEAACRPAEGNRCMRGQSRREGHGRGA